jgi:creatinine amidohydrolase
MKLEDMTWPEVRQLDRDQTLVVAPVASCEQHSHHLPTFTDSILVGCVADAVENSLAQKLLLLPVQWLGASDHHQPFGATITATVDHHIDILVDIVESVLVDGFRRILLLNGHGGNTDTMRIALRRLQPRYPDRILAGACYWDLCEKEWMELARGPRKTMGHACEFETAMMMHLRPESVRHQDIKDDHQPLPTELRGLGVARDFSQMTSPGAIGYPSLATPEVGKQFFQAATDRTREVCLGLLALEIPTGRRRRESMD